jgi:hypothetical protein
MPLAATRTAAYAVAAAAVETAVAASGAAGRLSAKAARAVIGEVNMPSRAVAKVLLDAGGPVANRELYKLSAEFGMFHSHRHFKHVLRMMKGQRRVQVISGPPDRPGGSKLTYRTKLTRRGEVVYSAYLGRETPPAETPSPGLTDAIS